MEYVFRLLKKGFAGKELLVNGKKYYNFPFVNKTDGKDETFHFLIPKEKTFIKNDKLYMKLNDESFTVDNLNHDNLHQGVNDNTLLKIISRDYLSYIINQDNYNPILPHAMNNFTPVGQYEYSEEHDDYYISKWMDVVDKLNQTYPHDLECVNPFNCSSLYPFHFNKFAEGKFVREYRSNIMMFLLSFDKHFVFTDEEKFDNHKYIYYQTKDKLYPVFKMINDKEFYETCLSKDIQNRNKTPFLKSFNDKGLTEELINFINEDETYHETVVRKYKDLRNVMSENLHDKKRFFVPSLEQKYLDIEQKLKNNEHVTIKEKTELEIAKYKRLEEFSKLYDQHKLFYFSVDELEDLNRLNINSASLKYISTNFESIDYNKDNDVVYANYPINEVKEVSAPILQSISKKELDQMKQDVYDIWIGKKLEETSPKKR